MGWAGILTTRTRTARLRLTAPAGLHSLRKSLRNQLVRYCTPTLAVLAGAWLAACASAPPIDDVPSAETYYNRGQEILGGQRSPVPETTYGPLYWRPTSQTPAEIFGPPWSEPCSLPRGAGFPTPRVI